MPSRSDIATAARSYLGELGAGFVTGTILTQAINRAQRRVNRDTTFNRSEATLSIKAGTREYSLPTAALDLYEVRLGTGADRKYLDPTSRSELRRDVGDWESATSGTSTEYWTDGMKIGFHPKPQVIDEWTRATAYAAGERVLPSATDNGFIYTCITAGTSSGTEPTWPTTIDGTIGEGTGRTPLWQQAGSTRIYYRYLQRPTALANATSAVTWIPADYAEDTIAKAAAIDLAGGFDAARESSGNRLAVLYKEYLEEVRQAKAMATRRARQHQGNLVPTGYGTYRR